MDWSKSVGEGGLLSDGGMVDGGEECVYTHNFRRLLLH